MNGHPKKMTAFICAVCIMASMIASGFTPVHVVDGYECLPVYINGVRATDGYIVGEDEYVPLEVFCSGLMPGVSVNWDEETQTASIEEPEITLTAQLTAEYLTANGRYLYVPNGVLKIGGEIAVPVDSLAECFGVEVIKSDEHGFINVDVGELCFLETVDEEERYDATDMYWLSRLISAESGNQSLAGMIAVGNVVLNRVEDEAFPDSIYGVISQYNQFDVFSGGAIYGEPNELSIIAAKLCLDGVDTIEEGFYFVNPRYVSDLWFRINCTYITTIGDHDFYA